MNSRTLLLLAVSACSLLVASRTPGAEGDWPEWRGPNRDGVSTETGLLKEWPAGGPSLVWKSKGLGAGYSSVSVVGDRVFTLGQAGTDGLVIALNRADGKRLWSQRLGQGGAVGWGDFDGPRATPTVTGGLVFAIGPYGEIVCLAGADGRERWRKHLQNDFGGRRPEWGFSESPLMDGDKVVFTPGGPRGAVVALKRETGAVVWQSKEFTDAAHYASLVIATIGGVRQYIQLTDASVAGLAADDGRLLWRVARKGATAVIPTPVYADQQVYVTSGYGVGCNLFAITPQGGKFSGRQVYANKVMANHHGGVVKIGDYIYGHSEGQGDNKGWLCQNFKTGEAVWHEKDKLGKGSVTYADGRLYCRAEDGKGTVALLDATSEGYREKGRFDPPDRSDKNSWAHPVIAGGKLYLRDQDVLLCYDVKAP